MSRHRRGPRTGSDAPFEPFRDAEEAWFWAAAGIALILGGARTPPSARDTQRPCDFADVINGLERLVRDKKLNRAHMRVAARYGHDQRRPNGLHPPEATDARLWEEAMLALEDVLRAKEIVA